MTPSSSVYRERRESDRRASSRRTVAQAPWLQRPGCVGLFMAEGIVLDDGRRAPVRLRERAAVLMALLATEGPRHRQAVAALLWPDSPAPLARNNLRTLLHRLVRRHELPLFVEGEVLALNHNVVQVRHDTADELADRILRIGADRCALLPDLSIEALEHAGSWIASARMRHREKQLRLLTEGMARAERLGDHGRCVALVSAKLVLDETSETYFRELMQAHLANGDRGAALATYERCRAVLSEVLGVTPERRTQELQLEILQGSRGVSAEDVLSSSSTG